MRDALSLDGVTAKFGAFVAVDDVEMSVADGELRVLLGANGAGKTTLMDMISGRIHCSRDGFGSSIAILQIGLNTRSR